MILIQKTITHGETYQVRYSGSLGGSPVAFDGTWTAAFRLSYKEIGGPKFIDVPMVLDAGQFVATMDTNGPDWRPNTYYYDVRFTPPGGTPFWAGATQLTLQPKNAPALP